MDIKDDHDDENANPDEAVPNDQLDDTLPYIPSPRQQDECQEQQDQQGDNLMYSNWVDDDEYQTLDPPDPFDDTFYTINNYWTEDNDTELAYTEDMIRQVDDEIDE